MDNITINNIQITNCGYAIVSSWGAGGGTYFIVNNGIRNNSDGIHLESASQNSIMYNNITNNFNYIYLQGSNDNNISSNFIGSSQSGINIFGSDHNIVYNNTIIGNYNGVFISSGSNNRFYHNKFIDNVNQATISSSNFWDNGYPDGGNYYDDFKQKYPNATDVFSGPLQNISGSDGIWDHPYLVGGIDIDHYPIVSEYQLIAPLMFMIVTLSLIAVCNRKHWNLSPQES